LQLISLAAEPGFAAKIEERKGAITYLGFVENKGDYTPPGGEVGIDQFVPKLK